MEINQIPYQIYKLLSMMTRRLDDHNFISWSYHFQILSESQDLFGYVDGSTPCLPKYVITDNEGVTNEISATYKEWNKTDKARLSLLTATLSSDIIDYVVGRKTSREAWIRLCDRYATKSRSHVMQLKIDMYTITKGLDSVEKYLMKVIRLRNQLLALGVGMEDEDIIVVVLNGLPVEYNLIKTIIRGRESAVAMQELRMLLLTAEQDIANKAVCIRQTFSATKSKTIVSQRCLNGNDNRSKAGRRMPCQSSIQRSPEPSRFLVPHQVQSGIPLISEENIIGVGKGVNHSGTNVDSVQGNDGLNCCQNYSAVDFQNVLDSFQNDVAVINSDSNACQNNVKEILQTDSASNLQNKLQGVKSGSAGVRTYDEESIQISDVQIVGSRTSANYLKDTTLTIADGVCSFSSSSKAGAVNPAASSEQQESRTNFSCPNNLFESGNSVINDGSSVLGSSNDESLVPLCLTSNGASSAFCCKWFFICITTYSF